MTSVTKPAKIFKQGMLTVTRLYFGQLIAVRRHVQMKNKF